MKIKKFVVLGLPILFLILSLTAFNKNDFCLEIKSIIIFIIFTLEGFLFFLDNKKSKFVYKFIIMALYSLSIFLLVYNFLYQYDLLKYFTSITATKELILATGHKGVSVFILIQIAQVVFLPIPAIALLVVGLIIYGPWLSFLYCSIGVLIGSYISFMIGKTFGYKLISWFFGDQNVLRYSKVLQNNGKYILAIVFLFPFFPDDLFCMISGVSSMTFKDFFIITTIVRPISIFIMCVLGGGSIFNLNTISGIITSIALLIITIIIIFILLKRNKEVKSLFLKIKKTNPNT